MTEIRELLHRYPPDCQPTHVESLASAGGMSGAQFWRITAPRGPLVLRRWPIEHPSPDQLQFIHQAIIHAADRGLSFIPVPIATRSGETFFAHAGHLWELAPWMPGAADYERSPGVDKLSAAMTALAQFHIAVSDFNPSIALAATLRVAGPSAIPRRLARLQSLGHNELHELSSAIDDKTWPEFALLARQFIAALPTAIPRAVAQLEPLEHVQQPLQPCLRDIWHDHVLFTGNEVTGLVDFGAVDFDTPETDIARLLGSLTPSPAPHFGEGLREGQCNATSWQSGLAAYSAIRPLSPQESLAVFAITAANPILAGCNWIRWINLEGRTFENRAQVLARFRQILNHVQVMP
jgi:Ser/Thr protein kinase RdoA (MazF antagonist)